MKASEDFNVPFLGKVPLDSKIVETGDSGEPFVIKNKNSDATKNFKEIVGNIENIINKRGGIK